VHVAWQGTQYPSTNVNPSKHESQSFYFLPWQFEHDS
jgi:hypothetical protein